MSNQKPKRRANHEGTLERLPNGLVRYRTKIGRRRISGKAARTQKEARTNLQTALKAHGNNGRTEVALFGDYVHDVLDGPYRERVRNGTLAPRTFDLYEQIYRLNIAGDPIAESKLEKLKPIDIEEWTARLMVRPRRLKSGNLTRERPMSPASKSRYIGFVSGVLEHARVKDKIVTSNVAHDADKPAIVETEFRILDKNEVEELIALASNERLRLIILLGLHGLGPAEMCGLQHEHVIEYEGVTGIGIRQQAQRGVVSSRLKTKKRRGWIPVDLELAQLLQRRQNGFVLQTDTGRPMAENNLRRAFKKVTAGTDFEGMTPYDLRHTFAMRLLEEGTDPRTVAELMRNTTDVVLRLYARSRPELKIRAIRSLRGQKEPRKEPTRARMG